MLPKLLSFLGKRDKVHNVIFRPNSFGILSSGETPSTRYLIVPTLISGNSDWKYIDSLDGVSLSDLYEFSSIIICRYFSRRWSSILKSYSAAGGRIIYFMDDDLMDKNAIESLPRNYAKKLYKNAAVCRKDLEVLCDEFWVPTQYLFDKYRAWSPRLLVHNPDADAFNRNTVTSVCYHGTASHIDEIHWLRDVVADLQSEKGTCSFELFGDHQVNRLYRDISGVSVLHPMSWDNYFAYTSSIQRDVGLAPLLPSPFNAARGVTKYFDFVRMGAVGIFSAVEPYSSFVKDGVDGILLPNDKEAWVEAIRWLAKNQDRRICMADMARRRFTAKSV